MPSDKDIVVEAREMAADFRYDIQPSARAMLRALADEVERLRSQLVLGEGEKSDVFSQEYAALGHDEKDTGTYD